MPPWNSAHESDAITFERSHAGHNPQWHLIFFMCHTCGIWEHLDTKLWRFIVAIPLRAWCNFIKNQTSNYQVSIKNVICFTKIYFTIRPRMRVGSACMATPTSTPRQPEKDKMVPSLETSWTQGPEHEGRSWFVYSESTHFWHLARRKPSKII